MTDTTRAGSRAAIGLALVVAFLTLVLGAGQVAGAQTVPEVDIVRTDLTEFPTVRLSVALSGETAESGAQAEDLQVVENGTPVDATVVGRSDDTLDVVLAIDVSGSMAGEPIAQAKIAAKQFLDELPDDARVGVVSFGNSAVLVSEFTTDRAISVDAIDALDDGGETALYDAVVLSAEQIAASDADRTALVVLTDGADTVSNVGLEQATGSLDGEGTDFFAVSLQTGEADEAALDALAEAADGSVLPATDPDALAEAYVGLGQRIANQFDVEFESVTTERTATYEVTVASTGATASTEIALPERATGGSEGGPDVEEEVASPTEVEPLVTQGSTDTLQQSWILWVGAGLLAVALGIAAFVVLPSGSGSDRRRSLRSDRAPDPALGTGERFVGSVRDAATRFGERAVERSEQRASIDSALDRAGLIMRAGEFVALVIGAAVVAGILLYLLMGIVGLFLGVVIPIVGAPAFLRFMAGRRNRKFSEQLGDTLTLMAGSLRSGFGLGQAIDNVAEEMEAPIGVEFQRAILETRLGRSMEDALEGIARRVQNEDFEWVVDAMRIHQQVGGDLAQILDKVADTIRARQRLKRQIAALTAEGRLSGIVLASLPVAMGLILYSTNPDYLDPLFTRTVGQIALGVGVGLLVVGALWLKKLIDVEL